MVELKNTSKAVVIFYGLLANGQAIVFMPEQTLEFAESVFRRKWQQFIAKWNSDVKVTKVDGVEPKATETPKADPKPKNQSPEPKKPATATPAEPKATETVKPVTPQPAAPAASSNTSGQPAASTATNTPVQPTAPAEATPAKPVAPKEGGGQPAASTDSAASNGGVSDEGLSAILTELGD